MAKRQLTVPLLNTIAMLLLANASIWPRGYYQALRWVVTGTAALAAYTAYDGGHHGWPWVLVGVAILFNPIAPIFLSKSVWVVPDLLVAGVLGAFLIDERKGNVSVGAT